MTEPSQLTTKGFPYPAGSQPANDLDVYIRRLAEAVDTAPGIAVLTTAQRDALSGGALWTGRVIRNSTLGRYQFYDGSGWVTLSSHSVLSRVTADAGPVNTTAETDLFSFSVPGGTLGTSGVLRLTLWGDALSDNGAAVIALRATYGATVLGNTNLGHPTSSGQRRKWRIVVELAGDGATNAQILSALLFVAESNATHDWYSNATSVAAPLTGFRTVAEDSTAAKTLAVTVAPNIAGSNIDWICRGALLERIAV